MCHGMPRGSRVAETLAEARAWFASLMADLRALCHLERPHLAPDAGLLVARLRAVPSSHVGQLLDVYNGLVADDPARPSRWPPPQRRAPRRVNLHLQGV
ncbi:hypothetical protein MRX96_059855 [Rhipicephalus microplus]